MFKGATFIDSCYSVSSLPSDDGSEVIFLGRSNVGKSTLINKICEKKLLARTSKTPGRTQCLNIFSIGQDMRLVDAPGYGFAKVPDAIKKQWHQLITSYCRDRECLKLIVIVMDIRHPLQPADKEWLDMLGGGVTSVMIVLNKMDCLGRMQQKKACDLVEQYCRSHSIPAHLFKASGRNGSEVGSLREFMADILAS